MAELYTGYQTRKLKREESKALLEARNRRMAAATREIGQEQRKKEHMHSRAVALAAASGGGVDDPTIVNLLGDLNAEGEYRIMSVLWSGLDEAAGLEHRARIAKKEGDASFVAGIINSVTSVMSAYSSFGGGSAASAGAGASGATTAKRKRKRISI